MTPIVADAVRVVLAVAGTVLAVVAFALFLEAVWLAGEWLIERLAANLGVDHQRRTSPLGHLRRWANR